MAMTSPSDLILDVTAAADPAKARAAAERLISLSADADAPGGFALALVSPVPLQAAAPVSGFAPNSAGSRASPPLTPFQKFEAQVLKTFFEAMLPAENSSAFGVGLAGNVWKSFFADALANQTVSAGGIGLASAISQRGAGTVPGTLRKGHA